MKDFGTKAARRPHKGGTAFVRDEDGIIAPLVLVFFFLMLVIGGIAVDVMRFETRRVAVQNTLDRATLAAASMEQKLSKDNAGAEAVVRDWFTKAGLNSSLAEVKPTVGTNYKTVEAKATVKSNNFFMSMLDVPYLQALSGSTAEQTIGNVEIALVLDVSYSMQMTPTRIKELRKAAKDFVDTVTKADREEGTNHVSIAVVPYNGAVNLGPDLIAKFNVDGGHNLPATTSPAAADPVVDADGYVTSYSNDGKTGRSYCLDLPTSTYSTTKISLTTPYKQAPFGQILKSGSYSTSKTKTTYDAYEGPTYSTTDKGFRNVWCQPIQENYVRLHNNDVANLKKYLDKLYPMGATSIDIGMKWGAFLLDPTSRPISASLAAVPEHFKNRPADFDDTQTMKVIVLMTDGDNFEEQRFSNSYRGQMSPIYLSKGDKRLSVYHDQASTSNDYFVPHLSKFQSTPYNSGAGTQQLTWNEVWAMAQTQWVAYQLYARPLCFTKSGSTAETCRANTFSTWNNNFGDQTGVSEMNTRLDTVCEAAKAKGIEVFGIAFEASEDGKDVISDCASAPLDKHYYVASTLNIGTAFKMIAAQISQLRLTQ